MLCWYNFWTASSFAYNNQMLPRVGNFRRRHWIRSIPIGNQYQLSCLLFQGFHVSIIDFFPLHICVFFLFFLELCSYFCFFSSIYFLMSPGDAMDACYIRYTHQKFRHFRSRFMSRAHFVEDLTLKPLQQQQQQQQQQQILRTVMITPKILVTSFLTDWEDLHSIFQQFDYLF